MNIVNWCKKVVLSEIKPSKLSIFEIIFTTKPSNFDFGNG
jgi:hypothetical protein